MESRRDFMRKGLYAAPVVMTVAVAPAFANRPYNIGKGNNGVGNGQDPQPPGDPPINDGPGAGPGDPGNKGG